MNYDYIFDVCHVEDNLFIVTATTTRKDNMFKVMIYTYYNPFSVYYLAAHAPANTDEFESQLFNYLGTKYNEFFK